MEQNVERPADGAGRGETWVWSRTWRCTMRSRADSVTELGDQVLLDPRKLQLRKL